MRGWHNLALAALAVPGLLLARPLPAAAGAGSATEADLRAERLARLGTAPLPYFRQVAALYRRCAESLSDPARGSAQADSLCGRISVLAAAPGPLPASDAPALAPLRRDLLASLRADFRPDSLLQAPDWARRARLAGYLDTAGFLAWARTRGVLPDSLERRLDSASARLARAAGRASTVAGLDRGGAGATAPADPEGRFAAAFRLLVPDFGHHLALARHVAETEAAGACLADPGCGPLARDFEVERLMEAAPDSSRQRLPVPWMGPFLHKLRVCLRDAIWFPDGRNPSDFQYSGYLFLGMHELSRSDSARIVAAIEAFGAAHSHLRQRADEPGWDEAKSKALDARCRDAMRAILAGVSPRLADFLSRTDRVDGLRLAIPGLRYPDLLGDIKLAEGLARLLADRGPAADPGAPAFLLPWSPGSLPAVDARGRGQPARAWARKFVKDASPLERNYLSLAVGPAVDMTFSGDTEGLRGLAAGNRRL